jgi:ABC-type phosphate transport system auxiliary subunit
MSIEESAGAPSWLSWCLTVIVGLLGLLWNWLRGDIKDLKENQKSLEEEGEKFARTTTVIRIEETVKEVVKMQGRFVTHDDLRYELEARFNEMDTRRLQMHNMAMDRISTIANGIEGLRADLREDLRTVHQRIDSGLRRRIEDQA